MVKKGENTVEIWRGKSEAEGKRQEEEWQEGNEEFNTS
jgi:hypothetical protein